MTIENDQDFFNYQDMVDLPELQVFFHCHLCGPKGVHKLTEGAFDAEELGSTIAVMYSN